MDSRILRKRLEDQDWDCCYCGYPIRPYDPVCVAFDGNGIAHLVCNHNRLMVAPARQNKVGELEWFCPFCGRHAHVNTDVPQTFTLACDSCEVVFKVEAIT
jgi:hypothetical protein